MNKKYGHKMYPVLYMLEVFLHHNRGVNIPLHHLRATTVLTASKVYGNRSREDGHTVNQIRLDDQRFESRSGNQIVFFKRSTQPPIPGDKSTGASS
jgi:hypothetical protein